MWNRLSDDLLHTPVRSLAPNSPQKALNRLSLPPYIFNGHNESLEELASQILAQSLAPSLGQGLLQNLLPTSVSADRLRELLRLPISRKLHITRSNYAIPIPFTLQLPPKLSAPSTPNNSAPSSVALSPRSPLRLVFTGKSYEPIDSESEEDNLYRASASPAAKPPSTTASRKKIAKFVQKTHSVPLDQLSMIEEKLTRANSMKTKSLPLLPNSPASTGPRRTLLRKPPPEMDPVLEAPVAKRVQLAILTNDVETASKLVTSRLTPLLSSAEPRVSHPPQNLASNLAPPAMVNRNNASAVSTATPPNGCLRQSTAFHHNLNNGTEAELRIAKRSFSDELHVSSVSSFSSVGDIFNHFVTTSPRPMKVSPRLLLQNSQERKLSAQSAESGESHNLWTSVQKSLDISVKDSDKDQESEESEEDEEDNDIADDTIDADILPLNVPAKKIDDNSGAGIGFNFPNNNTNVTNEKKKRSSPARKSHSSYSLMSPEGQIEIPNLDDLRVDSPNSRSDKIEPIGMPSKAARDHFKSMYGESTDSDSDSSFNSQFSKLNKSANAQLSPIKETSQPKLLSASPIRHARQRSMYNIDFGSEVQVSPQRKHTRLKSAADLANLLPAKGFKFGGILPGLKNVQKQQQIQQGNMQPAQQASTETQGDSMKAQGGSIKAQRANTKTVPASTKELPSVPIVVAEPPRKVQYAVDFKRAKEHPSHEEFSVKEPVDFYHRSTLSATTSRSSHLTYQTASEIASSYQSSRTARETVSTAPTDNDSVVIDLTKDGYNVCMIQRNDSQLSYRSVIEKTKDGKDVEVVLVEEDEEESFNDRDDLSSIYSRYMNDWVSRSDSVRSSASEASTTSANSWCNSESNFQVKSIVAARREQEYKTLRGPALSVNTKMGPKTNQTGQNNGNFAQNNGKVGHNGKVGQKDFVNNTTTQKVGPRFDSKKPLPVASAYHDYMAGKNYSFIA